MKVQNIEMLDITNPETPVTVEVQVRPVGLVLYVHVEGVSVLRVCMVKTLLLTTPDELERAFGEDGNLIGKD